MDIVASFELAVPKEGVDDAVPLSASPISADLVLIFTGGTTPNNKNIYMGDDSITVAKGMPFPGGAFPSLGAEHSSRGGFHLNRIFVVSADAGQVVRVLAFKDNIS